MLKKILIFVFVVFTLTLNVSAKSEEFYVYGQDNSSLSEILVMSENELEVYVETSNITYLAVNKTNTKQIKKVEYIDDFSKKVQSFLALRDNEILELAEDLSGIENIKGEVFEKGHYKFLKVSAKTKDSGGEYVLTQYITVNKGKKEILSFYTTDGEDTKYINEYFKSVFGIKETSATLKVLSIIGTVLFSLLAVVVLVAIVKETYGKKEI